MATDVDVVEWIRLICGLTTDTGEIGWKRLTRGLITDVEVVGWKRLKCEPITFVEDVGWRRLERGLVIEATDDWGKGNSRTVLGWGILELNIGCLEFSLDIGVWGQGIKRASLGCNIVKVVSFWIINVSSSIDWLIFKPIMGSIVSSLSVISALVFFFVSSEIKIKIYLLKIKYLYNKYTNIIHK